MPLALLFGNRSLPWPRSDQRRRGTRGSVMNRPGLFIVVTALLLAVSSAVLPTVV
jgi:hypothetical protein